MKWVANKPPLFQYDKSHKSIIKKKHQALVSKSSIKKKKNLAQYQSQIGTETETWK